METNSSAVASIWWKLPNTVLEFIPIGSKPWAREKPPKTSMRLPAAAMAENSRNVTIPMAAPIATWVSVLANRP